MQNDYLQYQTTQIYGLPPLGMQYPDAPSPTQQYQGSPRGYSSRVKDVRRAPSQQQADEGESEIRSQYIVAMPDNVWRAPH